MMWMRPELADTLLGPPARVIPEEFADTLWRLDHSRRELRARPWRSTDGQPFEDADDLYSIVQFRGPERLRCVAAGLSLGSSVNPTPGAVPETDDELRDWAWRAGGDPT